MVLCGILCATGQTQKSPGDPRENAVPIVYCFHNKNIDVTVLATIGSAHARNPRFGWIHLDSILHKSTPDLLLVQIRPEHFDKQEFFDGSPEMAYLAHAAQKMKIECRGIDWWRDVQLAKWDLVGPGERMQHIYPNIRAALASGHAQMVMIAIDMSLVDSLRNRLVADSLKEWDCPQAQFNVSKYPDLPTETIDFFKDGEVYLASQPSAGADMVQQRLKEMHEIVKGKGYVFKR